MRNPRIVNEGIDLVLSTAGFTNEMKLELFTLGKNSIMMRVENIGDIFNSKGKVTFQKVDIDHLAAGLFKVVNGYAIASSQIQIEETSLTGNQLYDEMVKNKIQWSTVDDARAETSLKPEEKGIWLQQQRIRVFKVSYEVSKSVLSK